MTQARVIRLSEAEVIPFGPLADYRRMTGDDGLPVFTGVQTCQPLHYINLFETWALVHVGH